MTESLREYAMELLTTMVVSDRAEKKIGHHRKCFVNLGNRIHLEVIRR